MTAQEPTLPGVDGPDRFDSTGQLLALITAQLSSQLSRVTLNGSGRPPALVAVAHGSRDPEALRTAHALIETVRGLRPGLTVRLGHLQLNEPLLDDTLAALPGDAVLVPLMLAHGHHTTAGIPRVLARAAHPGTRIAAPLGPHALLAEALHDRLTEAGWRVPRPRDAHRAAVVLGAAGSRDPRSARDTARTAALLQARLGGGVPVVPAYTTAGAGVADAVRELAAAGRRDIAVASCFAAPGRLAAAAAAAAPGIAAAPLGAHPSVAALMLHRYDQALSAGRGPADRAVTGPATAATRLATA
ncbi:sirohydrochlorin chelatase [Streptomyces sp. NPDC058691]|uniref:sirohydrochlorin chelatase n=1 Tax=Streptomyces sp. NPDC058691 TaxID=3346601 RepID=UPI0036657F92